MFRLQVWSVVREAYSLRFPPPWLREFAHDSGGVPFGFQRGSAGVQGGFKRVPPHGSPIFYKGSVE